MLSLNTRAWLIAALLLATGGAVALMQQRNAASPAKLKLDLASMVPADLGGWRLLSDPVQSLIQPPEDPSTRDGDYAATLTRTYVNANGKHVMLAIKYGSNQLRDQLSAHRPEFCYRASGFQLLSTHDEKISTSVGSVPIRRLLAERPGRREPISYWVTVNHTATLPGIGRKWAQLISSLQGVTPDGMLIRISSIDPDARPDYQSHDDFIQAFAEHVGDKARYGFGNKSATL